MCAAAHSGRHSPFPLVTDDTAYHLGRREPEIARARNRVLGSLERPDGVADGILPRRGQGIQRIVHVENRTINISDASEAVLGYIGTKHCFGAGENDRVGMGGSTYLGGDQVFQEIGIAVFLFQVLQVNGA